MWEKPLPEDEEAFENYTVGKVLARFMDIYLWRDDHSINWDEGRDEPEDWEKIGFGMYDDENYFNRLKEATVIDAENGQNIFLTTTFWTSMNNQHPSDFGTVAKDFLMAWELKGDRNFTLIKKSVIADY
jgi:hypothetical protein